MRGFRSSSPRYRGVAEPQIIEQMLVHGWAFEVRAGRRAAVDGEVKAALEQLVSLGLGFERSATGERLFDPIEVQNAVTWLGRQGRADSWRRCLETGRRLVLDLYGGDGDADEPPAAEPGPRQFSIDFERRFNLDGFEVGAPVRLRTPAPMDGGQVSGLKIDVWAGPKPGARLRLGAGFIDAQIETPEERVATVGFRATLTAAPHDADPPFSALDPADAELYTRSSEGVLRVTPRIRALAAELGAGAGAGDRWTMVRRFWDFLFDHHLSGAIRYDEIVGPATEWVLDAGWFDCQLGSALIGALCRASGAPARIVSGYVLSTVAPVVHYWLEVWLEDRGWVPMDTLSWDLSDGGRDLRWRDYYLGRLDFRIITQRLPRVFNGGGSVRLPPSWRFMARIEGEGLEIGYQNVDTGVEVFRDRIAVRPGPA